jgi:glycosyltransferase involved in cell wall biosynthesis
MSNKPKKILIDARMAGTQNEGIGRSIEELIKNLIKLDIENECYFLLSKENFSLADRWFKGFDGKRFHKILVDARWYTLKEQFMVPKEIRKINPDFVFFPHFNVPLFYFGKFIVTIHDLIWIKYPRLRKEVSTLGPVLYGIKNFFSKVIFLFAVRRARKIIVPTEFTKNEIMGFYKISSDKIDVVNWGIGGLSRFQQNLPSPPAPSAEPMATHGCQGGDLNPPNPPLRKGGKLGKSDNVLKKCYNINKPYLLYVGSAYPHKNLIFLLEVFKKVNGEIELGGVGCDDCVNQENPPSPPCQGGSSIQLVLAGKDSYFYQKLKQKVKELKLEDRVVFTGYVEDENLDLLYKNASLFVFPSLIEGFGFPPLEAMANGVPVLSSKSSCLPEVLGDAVLYFDPEDEEDLREKILAVFENENLRSEFVGKGFEQVKKYDWERCAEEYLEIIERI